MKIYMTPETKGQIESQEYFDGLSDKEKGIWLKGYDVAIKFTKRINWFHRLFKNYN